MAKPSRKDLEKKKLINLVIQGEGKNVKNIFHMPEFRDGLNKILGKEKGEEAYKAMIELTTATDIKDWRMSYENTLRMMNNLDQNAAGLVSVKWD